MIETSEKVNPEYHQDDYNVHFWVYPYLGESHLIENNNDSEALNPMATGAGWPLYKPESLKIQ